MRTLGLLIIAVLVVGCVTEQKVVDNSNKSRSIQFDQQEAAKTRLLLGLGYLKNKNFSQAKLNLEKAKQFAPLRADVHYSLAYYYQQVGDVNAATHSYQTAINLEPSNPDTLNNFGAFLCEQQQYLEAENLYLQAISIPSYTRVAETYQNMANCALQAQLYEKAFRYYKSALRHGLNSQQLHYEMAGLLFAQNEWLMAEQQLSHFVTEQTANANSLLLLALIKHQQQQIEAAQQLKQQLLQSFPDSYAALLIKADSLNSFEFIKLQQQISQSNALELTAFVNAEQVAKTNSQQVLSLADEESVPTELATVEADKNTEREVVERNLWLKVKTPKVKIPSVVVQEGENLFRISLKHNIQIKTLTRWNKLKNSQVNTGTRLYIRNPDIYYVVKQPQKLSTIARRLKIRFDDFKRWNNLQTDGLVAKGTKLIKVNIEKY